ncbi:unnamed protein product [Mesocestoides corti]|uniref:VWFC domain-containing protein n=1 Tax=Mesocestoides corti TaxID=53468 RepID=A0A158QSX5_MESCO|nr:unnamed protein product [Mesocestoides corti]
MTLLALSSEVTCLQEIQSKFPSSGTDNIVFEAEFHSDKADGHPVDFCVDSDGVRHGIFSSWRDSSTGCQCSCQSVGNVLVSLCDESCEHMLGKMENDNHILLSQNDEPFASLVYKGAASRQTSKSTPKAEKAPDKSCRDENSGSRYLDGQSWMSNVRPCAKCYCVNGTADCESSVLHCQSSCLPGQKSVSTGPCCDHVCIGQRTFGLVTALMPSVS